MTTNTGRYSTRTVSLVVAAAFLVTGCGEGSGESDTRTACDAMGLAALVTGGLCLFLPADAVTTTSSSSGTRVSRETVANLDVEPNNDLPTATVVSMEPQGGWIGFDTRGRVNGVSDPVDTYALTVDRRWGIRVQLCAGDDPDCRRGPIPTSALYVEVVDSLGNVVGSSPVDGTFPEVVIEGGLPYYIRIIANPWVDSWRGYYLRTALLFPENVRGTESTDAGTEPAPDGASEGMDADMAPTAEVPSAPTLRISAAMDLTVTLDWQPPTTYTDGTPLTSISEYILYVGDVQGGPYQVSHHLSAGLSSFMLTLEDWGHWYLTLAAVDSDGVIGELSVELTAGGPPPDLMP